MIRYYLHIVFVLFSLTVVGQELDIQIDKEEILIGEPFTLKYLVKSERQLDITYLESQKEFIGNESGFLTDSNQENTDYAFELLEPFQDTLYKEENQFIWEGKYILTGWDSAYVVILPESILIEDSLYAFPAGMIHVQSPQLDPTQPIYDINEIFTEVKGKNFIKKYGLWIGLLIVTIILFFVINRKKVEKKVEPKVIPLSLREETLKRIDKLESNKGYEVDLKEYYYDLSIILREFLASHFNTSILDKTTYEIENVLRGFKIDEQNLSLIRQLLVQSDMVKFAKSKPSEEEIKDVTNQARKVVREIKDNPNEIE